MNHNRRWTQIVGDFLGCIGNQFSRIQNSLWIEEFFDPPANGIKVPQLLSQVRASTEPHGMLTRNNASILNDLFEDSVGDALHFENIVGRMRIEKWP